MKQNANEAKTPEQLKAEEAAKKAAEKQKQDAAAAAAKAKADEAAKKVNEAITTAGNHFNTLNGIATKGTETGATITGESTVEAVKAADGVLTQLVKDAKVEVKAIKALGRKFKDSTDLQQAGTAADGLLAGLETALKSVKGVVSAAREADKARSAKVAQEKRDAAKAQKEADKLAKQAERDAKKEPEQNGVRKPSVGTLCRAVWDICDTLSATMGGTAPISFVLPVCKDKGLNEANVKAEYARWKKFNGIEGRVAVPVPANLSAAVAGVNIPEAKAE